MVDNFGDDLQDLIISESEGGGEINVFAQDIDHNVREKASEAELGAERDLGIVEGEEHDDEATPTSGAARALDIASEKGDEGEGRQNDAQAPQSEWESLDPDEQGGDWEEGSWEETEGGGMRDIMEENDGEDVGELEEAEQEEALDPRLLVVTIISARDIPVNTRAPKGTWARKCTHSCVRQAQHARI